MKKVTTTTVNPGNRRGFASQNMFFHFLFFHHFSPFFGFFLHFSFSFMFFHVLSSRSFSDMFFHFLSFSFIF